MKFDKNFFELYNITPNIIFDVGAHDQNDVRKDIHEIYPNCIVYQFEASPTLFAQNFKTIIPNAPAFNFAVADYIGETSFYESDRKNGDVNGVGGYIHTYSGSICQPNLENQYKSHKLTFKNQPIIINTITLKHFCEEHNIYSIDLLHIDVQGAELKVVMGLGCIRPSYIIAEVCEYNHYYCNTTKFEFISYVKSLGYVVAKDYGSDMLFKMEK